MGASTGQNESGEIIYNMPLQETTQQKAARKTMKT